MNSSQDEKCSRYGFVVKTKTRFISGNFFFLRKSCPLFDNMEKYGTVSQVTDDDTKRRMRFACRITKATDTHSEHVILIDFSHQKLFGECASLLRHMYIDCFFLLHSYRAY